MTKRIDANRIVKNNIFLSMGGGLIPLPLLDLAAVTAVQVKMLGELADLYEVSYSESTGRRFVTALTGTTIARVGASFLKAIPGIGTAIGGLSMSVLSGASTYAVGQVAINHFETQGDLSNMNWNQARRVYKSAFEEGKRVVSDLKEDAENDEDLFMALRKLKELKEEGIVTEEEYEVQKQKLLDRL